MLFNMAYLKSSWWWWRPGANTIAYYPLTSTSTISDMSGNGRNLTQNWNSDFWTYLGVDCVYVHWSNGSWFRCLTTQSITNSVLWNSFTLVFRWARETSKELWCAFGWKDGKWNGLNYAANNSNIKMELQNNWSVNSLTATPTTTANQWNLFVAVYDNWTEKWYKDWTEIMNGSYTVGTINVFWIWCGFWTQSSWYTYQHNGYVSNVIIENKVRTADEILAYYNQTKSLYGIS